jgi:hypothetical protein
VKYTVKKENEIFLIRKFRWDRLHRNMYMRKDFLIYEEMRKYFANPYRRMRTLRRPLVIYEIATNPV